MPMEFAGKNVMLVDGELRVVLSNDSSFQHFHFRCRLHRPWHYLQRDHSDGEGCGSEEGHRRIMCSASQVSIESALKIDPVLTRTIPQALKRLWYRHAVAIRARGT